MRQRSITLGVFAVFTSAFVAGGRAVSAQDGSPLSVSHEGIGCVIADRFPTVSAGVTPPAGATAKVFFRPPGGLHWYAVAMRREGDGPFRAVLPKPKASLKSFDYYVEATDARLQSVRTSEYRPTVAAGRGACGGAPAGVTAASAIILEAATGAPAIPAGFSAASVASSAAVSGASAGGLSLKTGALLVLGAGAAAVGVTALGSEEGGLDLGPAGFEPASVTCPDGATEAPIDVEVHVDVTNGYGDPVSVDCGDCVLTLCVDNCHTGTAVGNLRDRPVSVSPRQVPANGSATLRLVGHPACSNNPAGPPRSVEYQALFFLHFATEDNPVYTIETDNRLRIDYP
jgi:hypothetical protein